jgi:formylglycine-generating enzyme required for sulfatase activity
VLSLLEWLAAMFRVLSLLFIPVFLGLWWVERQTITSVESKGDAAVAAVDKLAKEQVETKTQLNAETEARRKAETTLNDTRDLVENLRKELNAETQTRLNAETEGRRKLEGALTRVGALEKKVTALDEAVSGRTGGAFVARVKHVAGIDLETIPGQEFFSMGSDEDDKDACDDEKPRHKVRISQSFYLGQTKVTVRQFRRFADAKPDFKTDAEEASDKKTWRDPGFEQTDDHPVVYISWNDAKAYCDWLDSQLGGNGRVRLPSEAEWEYCCRAGTNTKYHFGDDATKLGEYAWFDGNAEKLARPVKQKKPNDFTLYDMHGLVWEWCHDGKRKYKALEETDPVGPTGANAERVYRGGSFDDSPYYCRAAYRYDRPPTHRSNKIGFRVFVSR